MKRIKVGTTVLTLLVLGFSAARAQSPAKSAAAGAKRVAAAVDGLNEALSAGPSEGVSGAGDAAFSALGGFGAGDDSAVVQAGAPRSEAAPSKSSPLTSLPPSDEVKTCVQICIEFKIGPLGVQVCKTYETRC